MPDAIATRSPLADSVDTLATSRAGGRENEFRTRSDAVGSARPAPIAARPHPAGPHPATAIEASKAIRSIVSTNAVLGRQTDFSPANEIINRTLGRFVVDMTADCPPGELRKVEADPGVRAAREPLLASLGRAEGEMEIHWSRELQKDPAMAAGDLKKFLYFDNYAQLTELELAHFERNGDRPTADSHVAFVGSGALPLSAILMHQKTGARVTCVDCDPVAAGLSRGLIERVGLGDKVQVVQAKGEQADFRGTTHVIVAAMVPGQADVLKRALLQSPMARLGVRSAEGLRAMLYKPTDTAGIERLGTVDTGRSETSRTVINTMLTYRIAPRTMAPLDAG